VNWRLTVPVTAAVVVIWLLGSWITKYSVGEMAFLAPIAVLVVGATAALVLVWIKIVVDALRDRGRS